MRTATAILIGAGGLAAVAGVFLISRQAQAAQQLAQAQAAQKAAGATLPQEITAWAGAINNLLAGAFGFVDKIVGYVDQSGKTGAYVDTGDVNDPNSSAYGGDLAGL